MGSFSVAGYNRAEEAYLNGGGQPGAFPYVTWTISWNTGSTNFTITASKSSGLYEMDNAGLWSGYIWWGDFATVYNRWDSGETVEGYEINKWALVPDDTLEAKTYTTTVSLGRVPTDTAYIGFSCDGEDSGDECGFVSGYVEVGKASAEWRPAKTITVKEVKKNANGGVFDYGYYTVEMHSSASADQLRPPSQHPHTGYTYTSATSIADVTQDTTLYLIYNPIIYSATFDPNTDLTVSNMVLSQNIEYEGVVPPLSGVARPTKTITVTLNAMGGTLPNPEETELKSTASFRVWKTTVGGRQIEVSAGSKYIWTSDLTFYAQWGAHPSVTLPKPKRRGYMFVTWGVAPNSTFGYPVGSFTPTEDVELFAIWEACGVIQLFTDGDFHNHLVWLYKGDGLGPNMDGWHHTMPKIYYLKNNQASFYNVGGADGNAGGSGEGSSEVILPEIKTQPSSASVTAGATASFSVVAVGTDITYQWQSRTSSSGTWTNITGATNDTYSFTSALGQNGYQYRCVITNEAGSVTTNAATLTVASIPTITSQPASTTVSAGAIATFSITASGSNLSYQWYYRTGSSTSWNRINGATSSAYMFTTSASNDGWQYYCVVSNASGSVNSNIATLSVQSSISAYIFVTYPSGAICTATNGVETLQPYIDYGSGTCAFLIASAGDWTVTASDGTNTAEETVSVSNGDSLNITLSYGQVQAIQANVYVNCPSGTILCTMSKASETIQPTSTDGNTMVFTITSPGTWTIYATNGVSTATKNIVINQSGAYYSIITYTPIESKEPVITSQPQSSTVVNGHNASFSITATGSGLSYQWYSRTSSSSSWRSISGATGSTYSLQSTGNLSGSQYYCVVTNTYGTAISYTATLTVASTPIITTHPSDRTIGSGGTVNLTVAATGNALSYQWQRRTSSSGSWSNISGATSATYSFTAAMSNDGYQYRCVVTNIAGSATSNAATLTVTTVPAITTHPISQTVATGSTVTLTVAASGGALSYRWQARASSLHEWSNVSCTTASYTFTADEDYNAYEYRCIVTNVSGEAISDIAKIYVQTMPAIITHPESQTVAASTYTTFTVFARGTSITYQWQSRTSSSGSWSDISGETNTFYNLIPTSTNNGYQYRCRVMNAVGTVYSNIATLTVITVPVFTTQPVSQVKLAGASVTFTAVATGGNISYQWYCKISSTTGWQYIDGATNSSYTFTTEASNNGYQYHCVATNIAGTTQSNDAALTIATTPSITTHPASQTIDSGRSVSFTVVATGNALSYQWQRRTSSSGSWANISGATSASYTFTTATSNDGYQYRCVVTNIAGTVNSNAATLTVTTAPAITTQPVPQTVADGSTVTLTVVATGGALSYQWQARESSISSWGNTTCTTASYTFTAAMENYAYEYRCIVTNASGTVTSDIVRVNVQIVPAITTHPASQTVAASTSTTFTVVARGTNITYQWQSRTSSSGTWSNISDATSASYTFTPTTTNNGYQYRCVVSNAVGTANSNAATLTVVTTPAITTHPSAQTKAAGSSVTFTVAATGGALSYQWYKRSSSTASWTTISGATSASYTFTTAAGDHGYQYRCVVSNEAGTAYSNAATLTVATKPAITTHPASQTKATSTSVTFTVVATGNALSYQWQSRTSSSGTWANISGATSSSYTFTTASTTTENGYQYRCVVTNIAGTTNSNAATLTVQAVPAITTHPSSQAIVTNGTATFTVVATGTSLTYQWQSQQVTSSTWSNISGATSATYSFTATLSVSGYKYRCVVSNSVGTANSNAATLTVQDSPAITTHPTSRTVAASTSTTFTVVATGTSITYQWQSRTSSSGSWANISGATSASYTFTPTSTNNGYQYRCRVKNSVGTVYSNAATLTVVTTPTVTTHPSSQAKVAGNSVTFTVVATGGALSYQWYKRASSSASWTVVSGATSASYTFTTTSSNNGSQYRCNVTNVAGSVYSNIATLTIATTPTITTHPASQAKVAGNSVTFTVAASGGALSYQWQSRTSSSGTWANISGATSASYTFTTASTNNGYQYRCVVTNVAGTANSNAATLTIATTPTITTHPASQTKATSTSVTFTVVATGGALSYQWQRRTSSSGSWSNISGATSASYTFTTASTTTESGYQYRCVVTNVAGTANSNAATLTVQAPPSITTHPASKTVAASTSTTFTVVATGTSITYQWQSRTSSSGTWANISGATSASYTFTPTATNNGYQYRCVVKNTVATANSNAATLTVVTTPTITTHPASKAVVAGATATFTVAASGGALSYQWQSRPSSSGTWANIQDATSTSYSLTTTTGNNGRQYRCVVTNLAGSTASNAATLTVATTPTITTHPASQTKATSTSVTFTVVATGNGLSYQWQRRTSSSGTWANISGATSASYTFTTASTTTESGYQYRCVVTNVAGTVNSNAATLTVQIKAAITTHPASQTVAASTSTTFTVVATGTSITYQWQSRASSSGSWANISGATSASYTFTPTTTNNGYQYRCVVKNTVATVNSNAATLTVVTKPVFTTNPVSQTVAPNTSVTFTVVATGGSISYQWQSRTSSSGTWANISGATSASYTVTITESMHGYQYRCRAVNVAGTTYSSAASITCQSITASVYVMCTASGVPITTTSCVMTLGNTTVQPYSHAEGYDLFIVTLPGTWTVKATYNNTTKTTTVVVADGDIKQVSFAF